jgi:hypothetical protein
VKRATLLLAAPEMKASCPLLALNPELTVSVLAVGGSLDSHDLGRLALVASHFRRELLEDAARLLVERRPDRTLMPLEEGERWLRVLHQLEQLRLPLIFTTSTPGRVQIGPLLRGDIGSSVAKVTGDGWGTAICGNRLMRAGVHSATFRMGKVHAERVAAVGIVHAGMYDTAAALDVFDMLAGSAFVTPNGWGWTATGKLLHGNQRTSRPEWHEWKGQQAYTTGDMLSLRLDLGVGTLSASKNRKELGVIASGLKGSFCWCAELCNMRDTITILEALPGDRPDSSEHEYCFGGPSQDKV